MSLQKKLIGTHPVAPHIFNKWLKCDDIEPTDERCHRSLSHKVSYNEPELIEWLSERLIHHHYDDHRIQKLKQKFTEIGFPEYAEQHRKLPRADKTKKGNATEIILIEYIESCQDKPLVKAYKLRYNPNVDQSIKGDDTLLVDLFQNQDGEDEIRVFLGESKFRKTPSKDVVNTISEALGKEKLPLSYSFLVDELNRQPETQDIADRLDKFLIKEIKDKGNICYAGFLLSTDKVDETVKTHLKSDNPDLVFISVGIDNPQELINEAFKRAEVLIANPTNL